MQNSETPAANAVQSVTTSFSDLVLILLRLVVFLCGGIFLYPAWAYLFNPQDIGTMAAVESCAIIVSVIFIFIYIVWIVKGKAPIVLPYVVLGGLNLAAFLVWSAIELSDRSPDGRITGEQLKTISVSLASFAIMGILTWVAEKVIKKIHKV